MKIKTLGRKIFYITLLFFILFNLVAFIQAYRFTHYSSHVDEKSKIDNGFLKTVKMLATGVDNPRPENAEKPNLKYETIHLKSNVDLECWSMKNDKSKGTVILFHGYTDSKSNMLERAYSLYNMGFNIFLVDFMGSGGSEGSVTTIGYYEAENVKTAYDYIKNENKKNIVLFGTSMGSVAILKAINDYQINPEGIIIECPYASMLQTISIRFNLMGIPPFPTAHFLAFWGGAQHGFNPYSLKPSEYARQVTCPTLLIYGLKDQKVAMSETQEIYDNLKSPKRLELYNNSGHADYLTNDSIKWRNDVKLFLSENCK